MFSIRTTIAALAAVALALTACAGDDGSGPGATTTTGPTGAFDVGEVYVQAFAAGDGRSVDDMVSLAAPHSVAERYAVHTEAVNDIQLAAGEEISNREIEVEGDTIVVTITPPGGDPVPTEWSDFEIDDQDRLTSFTINGVPLDDRLIVDGESSKVDAVAVKVVSAFQLVTNDSPVVVLEITNGSADDYVLTEARYETPDGTVQTSGPGGNGLVVEPGEQNRVALIFGTAPFGGTVTATGTLGGVAIQHEIALT